MSIEILASKLPARMLWVFIGIYNTQFSVAYFFLVSTHLSKRFDVGDRDLPYGLPVIE